MCQAVGYCGASCQLEQWDEHQLLCGQISRQIEQIRASAEPLQTYRLPESSIVNLFQDNLGILECSGGDYYSARMILVDLLKKCGDLNNSKRAYDLAADNLLDLMALSYKSGAHQEADQEQMRKYVPGMLIAAEKDQEAYNFTKYFMIKDHLEFSIPYLQVEDQDIEEDLDIDQLYHHEMVDIALVKFKRMKRLIFERLELEASWKNFMMGTHPRAGGVSVVECIRGITLVTEKIKKFVFGDINKRITKLAVQVEELLVGVNAKNEYVVPGLVNYDTIPLAERSYSSLDASTISRCSGGAWLRATGCDGYLQYFIKYDKGMDTDEFDRDKLIAYFSLVGVELGLNIEERSKINLCGNEETINQMKNEIFPFIFMKKKWISLFHTE
jgi:hypothetical protein